MHITDKFLLIRDIPNIIDVSKSVLDPYVIERGVRRLFVYLEPHRKRIVHFSKDVVYALVEHLEKREVLKLVNIDAYPLSVTYNKKTDNILLNLISLGSSDLERIDYKNIYAACVYGICFYRLVVDKYSIGKEYAINISNFLNSILIHLFGKSYGLIGLYSYKIPKLRFLINYYILNSFFEITGKQAIYLATTNSNYDGTQLKDQLESYNFHSIKDFIKSLNDFDIMPGMNANVFVNKFYSKFGYSFMPALEDGSRFFATIATSSLKGTNVVPVFINKYNESEYNKLTEICKNIFRKKF
jgi:hypothetical protein